MKAQLFEGLYRLCDNPENEVNWNAGLNRDKARKFLEERTLPAMWSWLPHAIRDTTYSDEETIKRYPGWGQDRTLRAIIGVSGGVDSAIAADLTARAIYQSIKSGYSPGGELCLVNAIGLEDSPIDPIIERLQSQYGDRITIHLVRINLEEALSGMNNAANQLRRGIQKKEETSPGQLIPRAICTLLNHVGEEFERPFAPIDTTNGTEVILGEFCQGLKYPISPFAYFSKSEMYLLGEYLGIPKSLMQHARNSAHPGKTKPELYFGHLPEGITDRQVFEVLDPILYAIWKEKPIREISDKLRHSRTFLERVKRRIDNQKPRLKRNIFAPGKHLTVYPNSIPNLSTPEAEEIAEEIMWGGKI